jgi:hypothetical protein
MGAFNSNEYTWKDLSVVVLGKTITGITGLKYSTEKGKEELYGKGDEPLAIQHTNKSFKGEIKLLQSELEALEDAAKAINPNYDVTDINFDIVASYGAGITTRTDIVKFATVENYEKGMEQGDPNMEITLAFKAIGIQRGV